MGLIHRAMDRPRLGPLWRCEIPQTCEAGAPPKAALAGPNELIQYLKRGFQ